MDRREFLTAAAGMTLAAPAMAGEHQERKYRVGLIGTGWYGKCDLFRLIQIPDLLGLILPSQQMCLGQNVFRKARGQVFVPEPAPKLR